MTAWDIALFISGFASTFYGARKAQAEAFVIGIALMGAVAIAVGVSLEMGR